MERVLIIGGGSWGTAIAKVLGEKGLDVCVWVRRSAVCEAINKEKENPFYLPGIKLPEKVKAGLDLKEIVKDREVAFWMIPSYAVKDVVKNYGEVLKEVKLHISGIKGIDFESGKSPFLTLKEFLKDSKRIFVLGGPSFAKEIAEGLPAAVVVAGEDEELTSSVQKLLAHSYLRVYRSDDPIGVEIAGALKNVIAIASGICDGLGLGLNARAALITRGLIEIIRLGTRLGGKLHTFYGLAGLGDLVLTCTGALSRNYQVGYRLGRGETLEHAIEALHQVAEGVKTCKVVVELAKNYGVEMPICEEVYRVLYEKESPIKGLKRLLSRELKREFEETLLTKHLNGIKIDL
ncbi:MAG: NAD(P)-dependent glycerol-3-phosphate dehydrogenase [Thermodesulfobacteria bacterium]|nr:NAD(P)-dependent glycerol-3-phosphate dehydrogenase [Thermodesulfobacteriota bacterium]